jgi:hypothetical protein
MTMIRMRTLQLTSLAAGLLLIAGSFAQVPADAPAGTTGACKDGTYTSAASKRGACSGHKGVQTWYAATTGSSASGAPAPTAAPATTPAPSVSPATATPAPAKSSNFTPPATAAPGGGPGMVWVNRSSKVYHCQGDRWYGKTKNGAYMTEAAAKAEGDRPDHNKPCS